MTTLMFALIIGPTIVWLLYGILGPKITVGRTNRHNAGGVEESKRGFNGNILPAVRLQEWGEWRLKKLLSSIMVSLGQFGLLQTGTIVLTTLNGAFYLAIFSFLALVTIDSLLRLIRLYDYGGHGAEIMEAERMGYENYREEEIYRMIHYDNRQHMTPEEVDKTLKRYEFISRIVYALGSWHLFYDRFKGYDGNGVS